LPNWVNRNPGAARFAAVENALDSSALIAIGEIFSPCDERHRMMAVDCHQSVAELSRQ
jgi:hypothetical protein